MADVQPTAHTEHNRGRGDTPPHAPAEPRSFQPGDAPTTAQALNPTVIEAPRQIAEHGRAATRHMADAWRQAVDPLLVLQYDLGQLFDEMFSRTFGFQAPATRALRPMSHLSSAGLLGLPPADLKETDSGYHLAVELPGMTRGDLDVSIIGDSLVVFGQHAAEAEDATATYRMKERRIGRFERAFPLPDDVARNRIEARFTDGVLKIRLPRDASAAPQRARIEIKG